MLYMLKISSERVKKKDIIKKRKMATPFPDVPDIKMYVLYLAGGTPGLGISIRIQYDNEEDKMLLQKEEKIGYRENTEKIQLLIYEKDGGDNKV